MSRSARPSVQYGLWKLKGPEKPKRASQFSVLKVFGRGWSCALEMLSSRRTAAQYVVTGPTYFSVVLVRILMVLFASDQWKRNSTHLQQQQQQQQQTGDVTADSLQTKSSRDVISSNHVTAADTLSQLRQLPACHLSTHLSNHLSTWSPAHRDNQLLPAAYSNHSQVTAPTNICEILRSPQMVEEKSEWR